jgi:hypothetical protein
MTRSIDLAAPSLTARIRHTDVGIAPARLAHCLVVTATLLCVSGCKTDLSQQLLERELRMQEDQIYPLQDELQEKCARLDRTAGENTSLRRQLGFTEADASTPRRGLSPPGGQPTPPPRTGPAQPLLVPPTIDIPGSRPPAGGPTAPAPATLPPPGTVAPPTLEGMPPLPAEPRFPGAAVPGTSAVAPASATSPAQVAIDPQARPIGPATAADAPTARQLSHEESLADAGRITHLVVNPSRTECFDGNGDGVSDGLAIVIEPRDDDERLVTAAGDVSIAVLDVSAAPDAATVARWDIPAQEAVTHFRRTSRNRGLHFVLRWAGPPPQGDHVRVQVRLTTFEAASFETDCTVATKPQRQASEAP